MILKPLREIFSLMPKTFLGFLAGIIVGLLCVIAMPLAMAHACYDQDEWPWEMDE